ncbi:MAG: ATP-binding protein [Candidatus Melainabacteria bacterium]|nr:ATP-binding protein [Candidatus Melainabacteria bacterium]
MKSSDESAILFQAIFEDGPSLYMVLDPRLDIVALSNKYLEATKTKRHEIVGRNIFEVFPDNPDDPNATGVRNLKTSLQTVIETGEAHTMAVQKYDIRVSGDEGTRFVERYWSPVNCPVFGPNKELLYIVHRVEDVTDFVLIKQSESSPTKDTEELYQQIDRMEREIFVRGQEMQKQNREMITLNKELLVTRDQAIESSQLKSAFLANMSHELRTPLGVILGMSELLACDDLSEDQKEVTSLIEQSARALLALVNDILDLSKIEAGKMIFDERNFSPAQMVYSYAALLQTAAAKKDLNLLVEIDPSLSSNVLGDDQRVGQVLLNLLNNAIKFTEKGLVKIEVSEIENSENNVRIRFSVTDTGIGVSNEEASRLFAPFTQVDGSISRRFGGTGLGLAISKKLIELLGGTIGCLSEKGVGSTFWFVLPFKKSGEEKSVDPQDIVSYSVNKDCKILVVEDQPIMQDLLRRQFDTLQIVTDIVSNAEDGLEQLSANNYSLVLMDCHLPKMTGFEAARQIRKREKIDPSRRRIPIIAMTAGAMKGDREKCLESGMDDYLSKPYTLDELCDKLRKWV